MKYAVAYMNYFDNDLKMTSVEADNPVTALIEGVRTLMSTSDDDKWLDSFLEDIPSIGADATARIDAIKEEFFDADQLVAVMPI